MVAPSRTSARSHRPICKRVGRGASSYVRFEGLLSPAQVEQARKFAASQPVQQALSDAELFDGPGATQDRRSRVAWLDRAGHVSDRETALATYPSWLHNRLRDCAREVLPCLAWQQGQASLASIASLTSLVSLVSLFSLPSLAFLASLSSLATLATLAAPTPSLSQLPRPPRARPCLPGDTRRPRRARADAPQAGRQMVPRRPRQSRAVDTQVRTSAALCSTRSVTTGTMAQPCAPTLPATHLSRGTQASRTLLHRPLHRALHRLLHCSLHRHAYCPGTSPCSTPSTVRAGTTAAGTRMQSSVTSTLRMPGMHPVYPYYRTLCALLCCVPCLCYTGVALLHAVCRAHGGWVCALAVHMHMSMMCIFAPACACVCARACVCACACMCMYVHACASQVRDGRPAALGRNRLCR